MAYTTIDDPSAYFQTKIYTGNGGALAVTNDGNSDLQPDWAWFKKRGAAEGHALVDTNRGIDRFLASNSTAVEQHQPTTGNTDADDIASFDTDGFTFSGGGGAYNQSSNTYVAWQWKANGGTTASNTDGSITSTVQANTTAGFSIVTYTGNGSSGATIGHGLGAVPSMFIIKRRSGTEDWVVYHHKNTSAPETDHLLLNTTDATSDSDTRFNDTAPTSTLITMGNNAVINASGSTYVGYAFTPIQGYSKFGSYTGNGSTDGAFVYLGFKPAFVLIRATDVDEWRIYDHKRANAFNVINVRLKAHTNAAESQDDNECDFLSNGVKFRSNSGGVNSSGQAYIYMAFAESPFVSSEGVPTTAR